MPQRDVQAYVEDIQNSIREVEMSVAGLDLETYRSVRQIRSAVEREFMIIGGALRQLLQQRPELESRVTAAPEIIAFRNHLAHGYFQVADATVWDIIKGHLPELKNEINAIAREHSGD
jgi:uncharacterized protein with HEPN domain